MFSSNMNFVEGKQFLGEPKNKNLIFALYEASGEKAKPLERTNSLIVCPNGSNLQSL